MSTFIPMIDTMQVQDNEDLELKRIKKNVENAYDSFKPNYTRYVNFRNFIFVSAMGETSKSVNNSLQRPSIEANVIESYLSRMCGDFAKYEPGIMISASEDTKAQSDEEMEVEAKRIKFLEGHWRYILYQANKDGFSDAIYKEQLSGGYSSAGISTDYAAEKSFHQIIKMTKEHDQTLVFFDPMATKPDKTDGNYSGRVIPMRLDDFHKAFPDIDVTSMKFEGKFLTSSNGRGAFGPFQWSYKVGDVAIVMVAEYYEKSFEKTQLVKLSDYQVMLEKDYKKYKKDWEEMRFNGVPHIVIESRETEIVSIHKITLVQNKIIKVEETPFKSLPLKFFDGSSLVTKDDTSGASYFMTKPFFYHAEGPQRLKNFAIQSLANELENMRPAQIIASLESVPGEYLDAYRKPQNMSTLLYYQYLDGNPNIPLNPPTFAPRQPIPMEIPNTITQCDMLIQNIMGTVDANMQQMTSEQASGKAIQELMIMSNTAAEPYIRNFLLGLESCAQMVIDLIPLYYKSKRNIPVIDEMGEHSDTMVNEENGIMLDYEPGDFKVKIEAGVSFGAQQSRTLAQIIALSNAIPTYGEFINTEGLDIVMDNVEMRNGEEMRVRTKKWMQQQQAMRQQAAQAAQSQPNIEMQAMQIASQQVQMESQSAMAKIQQQAQAEQLKMQAKMADIELGYKKLEVEMANILAKTRVEEEKLGIAQQRADDERITTVIDSAIKQSAHHHDVSHKAFERDMAKIEGDRAHELEKEVSMFKDEQE